MRVLLDEHMAGRQLIGLLRKAGHEVQIVPASQKGKSDAELLTHAIYEKLIILTRDVDDYQALHKLVIACGGTHPGILTICADAKDRYGLRPHEIDRAIAKLEASGAPLPNHLYFLNQWR